MDIVQDVIFSLLTSRKSETERSLFKRVCRLLTLIKSLSFEQAYNVPCYYCKKFVMVPWQQNFSPAKKNLSAFTQQFNASALTIVIMVNPIVFCSWVFSQWALVRIKKLVQACFLCCLALIFKDFAFEKYCRCYFSFCTLTPAFPFNRNIQFKDWRLTFIYNYVVYLRQKDEFILVFYHQRECLFIFYIMNWFCNNLEFWLFCYGYGNWSIPNDIKTLKFFKWLTP